MRFDRFARFAGFAIALGVLAISVRAQQARPEGQGTGYLSATSLVPTNHPILPKDLSQLWLVPTSVRPAAADLQAALQLQARGEYSRALAGFQRAASQDGSVGLYSTFDMAVTLLNMGQAEQARRLFRSVLDRRPIGYLAE